MLVTRIWLILAASLLPARHNNRIQRLAEITVSSATVIISHLNSELFIALLVGCKDSNISVRSHFRHAARTQPESDFIRTDERRHLGITSKSRTSRRKSAITIEPLEVVCYLS